MLTRDAGGRRRRETGVTRRPPDGNGPAPPYDRPVRGVPEVVERLESPRGELVLRRAGDDFEIISNGVFLMDTRDGRSERELVAAALAGRPAPVRLLLGGLGVGFSLAAALASPAVAAVTVVEVEPAVLRWHRPGGPLAPFSGGSAAGPGGLADLRVTAVEADLLAWLDAGSGRYDAICLDIDNGPEWTVTPANAALYGPAGLAALDRRLAPGGVLATWSAAAAPGFEALLRERYATVDTRRIPVRRGEPDVIYLARGPRAAAAAAPTPASGRRSAAGGPGRTP
jgi:spermidine synthase